MTKEQIIDLIKDNLQYECYNGFGISEYSINTAEIRDKADEFLSLIEQKKKEAAKEIFQKLLDKGGLRYNELTGFWEPWCPWETIKQVATEYGVEL